MDIFDLHQQSHPDRLSFEDKLRRLAESDSRFDAAIGRMMIDLIECLRRGVVGLRLAATAPPLRGELLWLHYADGEGHHTTIKVGVDYYDRAPLEDGLPRLQYRLSYDRPTPVTEEELAARLEALRLKAEGRGEPETGTCYFVRGRPRPKRGLAAGKDMLLVSGTTAAEARTRGPTRRRWRWPTCRIPKALLD